MPDEAGPNHDDISTQLHELLEKKRLKVGARLVQTLEGDANAYFVAIDPATGTTGLYYHDQPHIDPAQAVASAIARAPEAPPKLVVTDDTVVPRMLTALVRIHEAASSTLNKKVLTVVALLQLVCLGSWPDKRPAQRVCDLLPPPGVGLYRNAIRGMVAAIVAWLREGDLDKTAIKTWFDRQTKARQPQFVLDFTSENAHRWFYGCTQPDRPAREGKGPPQAMIEAFGMFRPDPSRPLTQEQAIEGATELLNSVCLLSAVPLTRSVPRRRSLRRRNSC
jgi:hypothetical protein